MNERQDLLLKVQRYRFILFDISLYLDSHKDDEEALSSFKKYSKDYMEARNEYVKKFGPLSHADMANEKKWTWTDDPWPWEVEG
jgi:spore coat protein JB